MSGYSRIKPFAVERRRVFCMADGTPIGKPDTAERNDAPKAMSAADIVRSLEGLATQARRLRPPMSSNPDAFHEDKSEIIRSVERLKEAVRLNRLPQS